MIRIVLLSGVNGAGKSTARHIFEEKGYRVIENIPNEILPAFLELAKSKPEHYGRTLIMDELRHFIHASEILKAEKSIEGHCILLGCAEKTLFKRFALTRHAHPLQAKGMTLEDGIKVDAVTLELAKPYADAFIDTTDLEANTLQDILLAGFEKKAEKTIVFFNSFGYKFGVPLDAELVLDCRNLPNPYWEPKLKNLTGLDKPVQDFFQGKPEVDEFMAKTQEYLDFSLKQAVSRGRKYIHVAFGCTGGEHRSVYMAEHFYKLYKDQYPCVISHRDLPKKGK